MEKIFLLIANCFFLIDGFAIVIGIIAYLLEAKRHEDKKFKSQIYLAIFVLVLFSYIVGAGIQVTKCACGIPMIGIPAVAFATISVLFNWIYFFIIIRKEKINVKRLFGLCLLEIIVILILILTLKDVFPFEHNNLTP